MHVLKEHKWFVLIFVACSILRLLPLFDYQFTYDELSGLQRTQFRSLRDLFEHGIKIDAHPALVQVFIFYLVKAFGYATWIFKLPFIVCSLLAVVFAYRFCIENFTRQSAIVAAIIFSFSLVFVYYAPIARMYINGVLFSVAMLLYFFRIIFRADLRKRNFVCLGFFALLSALSHHINALFALTLISAGLFYMHGKVMRPYLVMCAVTLLLYMPHLPVTLYQLGMGGIGTDQGGWLEKPDWRVFPGLAKVLFGTGYVWIVFMTIICISVVSGAVRIDRRHVLLLLLFAVNFATVFLYSVYRAAIYQDSVMLFAGSGLILAACSLTGSSNKAVFCILAVVLSGAHLVQTYIVKDYFDQCVRNVYETQYSVAAALSADGKKVHGLFPEGDPVIEKIYGPKYGFTADAVQGSPVFADARSFARFVSQLPGQTVVLGSASPERQAVVQHYFPFLKENIQTQGINVTVYSKHISVTRNHISPLLVADTAAPGPFRFRTGNLQEEFPFEAQAKIGDVVKAEGQVVLVSCVVEDAGSSTELCISAENGDVKTYSARSVSDFVADSGRTVTLYAEHFFGRKFDVQRKGGTIKCYLWNRGRKPFLLRKFEIRVIDYSPWKWNFWK